MAAAAGAAFAQATYVGAAVCAQCHSAEYGEWSHARHGKMIQPASPASVKGDFGAGQIKLRGLTYGLRRQGAAYYISESYLTGKRQEHRVDYTLGSRRIQHYLTRLPDGRIILLPPSWDVQRKQWFHNLEIVNPEETERVLLQVWNRSCFGCHVSREDKGFDPERLTYATRWTDFGTNCERCHGPGSLHAARYRQSPAGAADPAIVLQTRLTPLRNTMVCAQCHSLRNPIGGEFRAGADYYDSFFPVLEYGQKMDADPAYWADGRPRRFAADAIGFWESRCFLQGGATCINCHVNVHDPEVEKNARLRPTANTLCASCHRAIVEAGAAHTHHATGSAGSSCVECHMPRTVFSIRAAIRDHSLGVPAPENTVRYGIPNACNVCHRDRTAGWAAEQVKAWYGPDAGRARVRRAEAFTRARQGDPGSIPLLLAILADPAEGAILRANAAGHLVRFAADPRARAALEGALHDPEELVRAVAASRLPPGPDPRHTASALAAALADPVRIVRFGATLSLVNMGIGEIRGPAHDAFERGKQEAAAHYATVTDDTDDLINAGRFYYLTGNADRALAAFRAAGRIDPSRSVQYFEANVYVEKGDFRTARTLLRQVPRADTSYTEAQKLLQAIAHR